MLITYIDIYTIPKQVKHFKYTEKELALLKTQRLIGAKEKVLLKEVNIHPDNQKLGHRAYELSARTHNNVVYIVILDMEDGNYYMVPKYRKT